MRRISYRFLPVAVLLLVLGVLFAAAASVSVSPGQGAAGAAAHRVATFAGGCFWCVEADFEKVEGVLEAVSGFAGGSQPNPRYKHVASGSTRHLETVQLTFDPDVVSYLELLEVFWTHVDPTDPGGQFVDRGHQYTTAIFYADEEQKRTAESSLRQLEQSGVFKKPIVTAIRPLTKFYAAEDGHQDYYKNNSFSYRFYRYRSGRDQFLEATWKDRDFSLREISFATGKLDWKGANYMRPDDGTLRNQLTDLQYQVTQHDATEPAFRNDYWDNKAEGIYVDVVSGKPLFSSLDKFDSRTGWPSFFKPLEPDNVVEKTDRKFFMTRTEVRSEHADSHLGHLFEDGPAPTGLRYCINSAALRFIPRERLEDEGYGQFLELFKKSR